MPQLRFKGKRKHLLKVRLRLPPAEIGEGPGGIPKHGQLGVVPQLVQEGVQGLVPQHQIPADRGIPCDVAQSPHRLHTAASLFPPLSLTTWGDYDCRSSGDDATALPCNA
jgi:hypothetical protein